MKNQEAFNIIILAKAGIQSGENHGNNSENTNIKTIIYIFMGK